MTPENTKLELTLTTPRGGLVEQHPLVCLLMDYDNCPDHAVDAAAELVGKLLEIHTAAGNGDWNSFMANRSIDWFDEVSKILSPFEKSVKDELQPPAE